MPTLDELAERVNALENSHGELSKLVAALPGVMVTMVFERVAVDAAKIVRQGSRDIFFTTVDSVVEWVKWPFKRAKEAATAARARAAAVNAVEA